MARLLAGRDALLERDAAFAVDGEDREAVVAAVGRVEGAAGGMKLDVRSGVRRASGGAAERRCQADQLELAGDGIPRENADFAGVLEGHVNDTPGGVEGEVTRAGAERRGRGAGGLERAAVGVEAVDRDVVGAKA